MNNDCPVCGGYTNCLAGQSAHSSNWYCANPKCGWQAWDYEKIVDRKALTFDLFREANLVRATEWIANYQPTFIEDILFRSNELGDECGEVQGACKKLVRMRWGMPGGITHIEAVKQIANELADVIISADRLASLLDINLSEAIITKFNATSDKHKFKTKL